MAGSRVAVRAMVAGAASVLLVGCGLLEWAGEIADAMRETGLMARVLEAYDGLVQAHGEPRSDADAMRLLEQATGLVLDRREQLRGIGKQVIDAAIGVAGLLGFQGIASGRGRQLWRMLLTSLAKGQGRRVVATSASLVGAAHSGRVLGAERVLAAVPHSGAALADPASTPARSAPPADPRQST